MKTSRLALSVVFAVILGLIAPSPAGAFTVPAGFIDQPVVSGTPAPTAIDWLPDGTLLIATQGGILYRWDGGPAQPVLDLTGTICSTGEMGLLGLAVDPDFDAGERFIYLYYTDQRGTGGCGSPANRANRVSRFSADAVGNIVGGSEQILVDSIAADGANHNGGDLQFGRDELLYISVGDAGTDIDTGQREAGNNNAQRRDLLNGKLLRITRNGGIPASNPFQGADSESCAANGRSFSGLDCQEIYAFGLRNPFRIVFDTDDTSGEQRLHINDVGSGAWEEIDIAASGANYGWSEREGPCPIGEGNINDPDCQPVPQFTDPIFAYNRNALPAFSECRTITGGAFVPDAANWPAAYDGVYLFADLGCQKIFALRSESPGQTPEVFATGTAAVHLAFGPDNILYYTDFFGAGVRRILPGQGPPPPDNPPPPPAPQTNPVPTALGPTERAPALERSGEKDKKNDKKGKKGKRSKHKKGKKKHDKNSGKHKQSSAKHKKSRARR